MRSFSCLGLLAKTFAVLAGCSVLYDLDGEQCNVDGDCDKLGGPLTGRQCVEHLCVAREGDGGSAGSGGSTSGGSNSAGNGGSDVEPGCETHAECMNEADGLPAVCREGTCVTLVNGADDGQCTVVLGIENLEKNRNVFVFGAFSAIPDARQPLSSPITLNFDYVINKVTQRGGLRIQGKTTYPVAVVCNALTDSEGLDKSFDHLVDDVGVPAIISSLYALELERSFTRVYDEEDGKGKKVFFLSPFESDTTLTNVPDSGLLWHLLPDSTTVAPTYIPLFERIEAKVLETEAAPLRVALIQNEFQWLTDVADLLRDGIEFNGLPLTDPGNAEHRLIVDMDSAELNGIDNVEWVDAYNNLKGFKPHIIVSAAGSEFYQVMEELEAEWDSFSGGQARPYYVLSPFQYGAELTGLIDLEPTLGARVAGINTASAEDKSLYEKYLIDFKAAYDSFSQPALLNGTENFYDAALFTLLAAAAAGNVPELTGIEMGLGMRRLVDTVEGTPADMTLDKVMQYSQLLNTSEENYALTGTLGPPDFNVLFGTRKGSGSVWCVMDDPPAVHFDVLRYDDGNLTGTFPCFDLSEP